MSNIRERLKGKMVVSCQAYPGDPMEDTETICRIARCALANGAGGLRINSAEHIAAIRRFTDVPVIGIQKGYSNGQLRITPDFASAAALANAGASIIALDCTQRAWTDGDPWQELVSRIQRDLQLPVMADISTLEEARAAASAGADFIGTTLNGYTEHTRGNNSFDWRLLANAVEQLQVPVIAEGHITTPELASRALAGGAWCVVVGSAITRPGVLTANFVRAMESHTSNAYAFGIDVGGTSIKGALVKPSGEIKFPMQNPTNASGGRKAISDSIAQTVEQVLAAASDGGIRPIGIGIASAGAINAQDGSVFAATDNLPGWTGFQLSSFVEERFHLPTWSINDAHAAVLAELRFGLGRELSDFVAITIGTGIGGGIVSNGKLLRGQNGFAGTFGHHVIRVNGKPCNCGRKGCLEAYVSTAALLHEYKEISGDRSEASPSLAFHVSKIALAGDVAAQKAYAILAGYLAEGIANIFNILDPEAVLISGGIVEGHPQFVAEVERQVTELLHFGSVRQPRIQLAAAGHYAGVQGAGALVFEEHVNIAIARPSPNDRRAKA